MNSSRRRKVRYFGTACGQRHPRPWRDGQAGRPGAKTGSPWQTSWALHLLPDVIARAPSQWLIKRGLELVTEGLPGNDRLADERRNTCSPGGERVVTTWKSSSTSARGSDGRRTTRGALLRSRRSHGPRARGAISIAATTGVLLDDYYTARDWTGPRLPDARKAQGAGAGGDRAMKRILLFRPERCLMCSPVSWPASSRHWGSIDTARISHGPKPPRRLSMILAGGTPWPERCRHCTQAPCAEACSQREHLPGRRATGAVRHQAGDLRGMRELPARLPLQRHQPR